ncbi:MAG: TldD/PmbA family protein [Candidatus Njordarchaeales archaeon]
MIYQDLFQKTLDKGLELGADEIEIYFSRSRQKGLEIEMGEFRSVEVQDDIGVGIRVIKDKKIGFSYTTKIDEDNLLKAVKDALSIAKSSKEIEDWHSLPEASKYPSIAYGYDKRIVEVTSEYLVEIAGRMVKAANEYDKRAIPIGGGVGIGIVDISILNSRGVSVSGQGTFIESALATIARSEKVTTPICFDMEIKRTLDINPENIGKNAAEYAIRSLKLVTGESGKYPVIFTPYALSQILTFTLVRVLNGDYIKRGVSPFINKINEKVATESLTLVDDGTWIGGVYTRPFDDEGVPTRRTILIEKGYLRSFYYDNYTGKALGKESTGNGLRVRGVGGGSAVSYMSTPTVSPTNFIIQSGDSTLEEMIQEVGKGYIVGSVQGAHSSNPESGEFSIAAAPIWKIEDGEIKGSVPGTMVSGNIYELLKSIRFIGKDLKVMESVVLPHIAFDNVNVIVKK